MKRRAFIAALGGAVVWPMVGRAQRSVPSIGYLSALGEAQTSHLMTALRRGLGEAGFVDGQTVAIDYRFADGKYDRLPPMAAELVRRPVSLIITAGPPAA